jgi:hypothetical protein
MQSCTAFRDLTHMADAYVEPETISALFEACARAECDGGACCSSVHQSTQTLTNGAVVQQIRCDHDPDLRSPCRECCWFLNGVECTKKVDPATHVSCPDGTDNANCRSYTRTLAPPHVETYGLTNTSDFYSHSVVADQIRMMGETLESSLHEPVAAAFARPAYMTTDHTTRTVHDAVMSTLYAYTPTWEGHVRDMLTRAAHYTMLEQARPPNTPLSVLCDDAGFCILTAPADAATDATLRVGTAAPRGKMEWVVSSANGPVALSVVDTAGVGALRVHSATAPYVGMHSLGSTQFATSPLIASRADSTATPEVR